MGNNGNHSVLCVLLQKGGVVVCLHLQSQTSPAGADLQSVS
jgi:hypothetical protein